MRVVFQAHGLSTQHQTFTAFIRWVKKKKRPKLCLVKLQLIRADKWRRMQCATTSARVAAEIWMRGVSARLSRSHFSRSRRLSGISCDRGIQGERGLLQKPSPLLLIICQPGLTGRGTPSHRADRRATCAIGFGRTSLSTWQEGGSGSCVALWFSDAAPPLPKPLLGWSTWIYCMKFNMI